MAHLLSLTDGTTTKTLADGTSCLLRNYVPKSSRDGEDVTETVDVTIQGASLAAVRTYMNDIGALFSQAEFYEKYRQNYIKDNGSPVYVNFDPNTSGTTLRSRLKSGRIIANSETLVSDLGSLQLDVTLEWTRQGYFEGPETEIALSSTYNGAGATGGYVVKNRDDAGGQNRAYIPAGQILGDMPAPLKLAMANDISITPSGNYINEIIIGHGLNAKNTGVMAVEAEIAGFTAGGSITTTTPADAACSGGYYRTLSWTSGVGTEVYIGDWGSTIFSQSFLRGNRYLIILRLRDTVAYTNLWLKIRTIAQNYLGVIAKVLDGNLVPVTTGRHLIVLDTFRNPPFGTNNPSLDNIRLGLVAVRSTAAVTAMNLDYIYFMPISGDSGWMRLKNTWSTGIRKLSTTYYWLTIDPYNPDDFQTYSDTSFQAAFSVEGGPIMLMPGVWQYLTFLASYVDGTAPISIQMKVLAYYRPRYNLF